MCLARPYSQFLSHSHTPYSVERLSPVPGTSSCAGQAEIFCRAARGSAPNVTVVLQLARGADEAVRSSGSRLPAEFYPPEICASAGQIT